MKKIRKRLGYGVLLAATAYSAAAAAHEQHGGYSAGEPGNPKKPAREIVVLMNEMDYSPATIEVKRGEQIRFVIRNVGTEAHDSCWRHGGKPEARRGDEKESRHGT